MSNTRDGMLQYYIHCKESEFTILKQYNLFVGTWNVNGQSPDGSLRPWLRSCYPTVPDVYAIGFQELDMSKEAFLFDYTPKEVEWQQAVVEATDPRTVYRVVAKVRLIGMFLIVLVRDELSINVTNVATDTVGTGIMGKMGNKGGVSVRFELYGTSICFINAHLAAHEWECERRNRDYREICSRTRFQQPPRTIENHDQVYWLGDFNYRLKTSDSRDCKRLLMQGDIANVLALDQLRSQHVGNKVFCGYREEQIAFQPTYKYEPGTNSWDSNRNPAWCDRVLYKGANIEQTSYESHPELNISDHKPVSATFSSHVKDVDLKKYKKVHREVLRKYDALENKYMPRVKVHPMDVIFDRVGYMESHSKIVCVTNVGSVPAEFEFAKKINDNSYCKEWLSVEPNAKCLSPGRRCNVKVEIFVDQKSAHKFNQNQRLHDVLVLRLYGGNDTFVTVQGVYERSCFGCSLEDLARLNVPFAEAEREDNMINVNYAIPKEVWFLVDHVYKYGLKEPELFDRPGLHSEFLAIRDWLDKGSKVSPIPGSVYSVVDALAFLLQSTPVPVIPRDYHAICANVCDNYAQCKGVVDRLPMCKKNVFWYLCVFLQEVLKHSDDNGTDVETLALSFAAIFFRFDSNSKCKSTLAENRLKTKFVRHFLRNDLGDAMEIEKMHNDF